MNKGNLLSTFKDLYVEYIGLNILSNVTVVNN